MSKLLIFSFLISWNLHAKIDEIIVYKNDRELLLMDNGKIIKQYEIRLSTGYLNPFFKKGPKRLRGDRQTPEGNYSIIKKRKNTNYRKSLLINYPNRKDKKWGKRNGHSVKELGNLILIHGERIKPSQDVINIAAKFGIDAEGVDFWAKNVFYPYFDWTNGCIAVDEFEMDEIFELISVDTAINIYTNKPSNESL